MLWESMKLYLSVELTQAQQTKARLSSVDQSKHNPLREEVPMSEKSKYPFKNPKKNPYMEDSDKQGEKSLVSSVIIEDSSDPFLLLTASQIITAVENNNSNQDIKSILKAANSRKGYLENIKALKQAKVSELYQDV